MEHNETEVAVTTVGRSWNATGIPLGVVPIFNKKKQ